MVVALRFSSCNGQAYLPHDIWDLSSPNSDLSCVLCFGRWILNHWITREVLAVSFF